MAPLASNPNAYLIPSSSGTPQGVDCLRERPPSLRLEHLPLSSQNPPSSPASHRDLVCTRAYASAKACDTMNYNVSATLNAMRLLSKPSLCLPHQTVSTFNDLPIPLDKGLQAEGRKANIKAVVLDKDDCFAYPDETAVYDPYKVCALTVLASHPRLGL